MANEIDISIIIPAYNEAERLPPFLSRVISFCKNSPRKYEIIIVDDGSTDGTYEIASSFRSQFPDLAVIKNRKNRGKGYAVRRGLLRANGTVATFLDADGSVEADEIEKNIHYLAEDGYDIFAGSRVLKGESQALKIRWYRKIPGTVFNFLVQTLLFKSMQDTQCGFKMFRKGVIRPLFARSFLRGFGFDIEILFLAHKFGYRIKEGPVSWKHVPNSKVNMLTDSVTMFIDILRIRKRHRTTPQKLNRTTLPSLLILGVGLVLVTPMFFDCRLAAHDFIFHRLNSYFFAEQLVRGNLYPRWLSEMNAGLGSPVMFFYGPIPYYFSAIFHVFSNLSQYGCHDLTISCALATVASGIAAYFWIRSFASNAPALLGSIVYMLMPYHLSIDLYTRFALAEYWTFVWLPLAMFFARKIANGSFTAVVGLGLSLGLVILTHLPSFVIIFPFFIVYALFLKTANLSIYRLLLRLFIAILICAGVSAIYWLPALATQAWVSMTSMTEGYFKFSNHFLFEGPNKWRESRKVIERSTLIALATALCAWMNILLLNHRSPWKRDANVLFFIALFSIFMMLSLSQPLWNLFPILQRVQFPWRYHIILVMAVSGLAATSVDSIRQRLRTPLAQAWPDRLRSIVFLFSILILVLSQLSVLDSRLWAGQGYWILSTIRKTAIIMLICVVLTSLRLTFNKLICRCFIVAFWLSLFYLLGSQAYFQVFTERSDFVSNRMFQARQSAREHFPRWLPPTRAEALLRGSSQTPRVRATNGSPELAVIKWEPGLIIIRSRSNESSTIELKQLFYPNWTAAINEKSLIPAPRPSADGLIELSIPAGENDITVKMQPMFVEKVGSYLTGLTLAFCALLFMQQRKKGTHNLIHSST